MILDWWWWQHNSPPLHLHKRATKDKEYHWRYVHSLVASIASGGITQTTFHHADSTAIITKSSSFAFPVSIQDALLQQ